MDRKQVAQIFGERLRVAMLARNVTPENLALKLGLSKGTIRQWLSKNELPSICTLVEICGVLDVPADYLIDTNTDMLDKARKYDMIADFVNGKRLFL